LPENSLELLYENKVQCLNYPSLSCFGTSGRVYQNRF